MKDPNSTLLVVKPDGESFNTPNAYDSIKAGVDGAYFDFVVVSPTAGYYIKDEGMLDGSPLNVPASMFAQRALYGPVVLCAARPDEEGDTQPPNDADRNLLDAMARAWHAVSEDAVRLGQDITVSANENTIPPPQIVTFENDEELFKHMGWDEAEEWDEP